MIPLNYKVSIIYFTKIIELLFLKFEYKRTRNETCQEKHLIIQRLLTDNLLDLFNLEFNNEYIDKQKLKKN